MESFTRRKRRRSFDARSMTLWPALPRFDSELMPFVIRFALQAISYRHMVEQRVYGGGEHLTISFQAGATDLSGTFVAAYGSLEWGKGASAVKKHAKAALFLLAAGIGLAA